MCPRCKEDFTYDENDERTFIYHTCPDGCIYCHKKEEKQRQPKIYPSNPKKKTIWFGGE